MFAVLLYASNGSPPTRQPVGGAGWGLMISLFRDAVAV